MLPQILLLLLLNGVVLAHGCSPGSIYSPNRAKCLTAVPVPLSYRNAELSCGLFAGKLAKIESLKEYDLLIDHVTQKGMTGSHFWLGGTNINTTWTWSDGQKFTFASWEDEEPRNPERENCLMVDGSSKLWKSRDCDELAHYVCEMEPKGGDLAVECEVTTPQNCPPCQTCAPEPTCPPITECPICPTTEEPPTTTARPKPLNPKCPFHSYAQSYIPDVKWRVFNGHQYALSTVKRNFTQAEAGCAYFGAHLTSIHSREEQSFVESFAEGAALWIGGIASENGEFCWTDRSSWGFSALRGEDALGCIATSESGWKREGCEEDLNFICKRRYWG